MTLRYSEFNHWSVTLGGRAVRLSVADEAGREYFMIVPKPVRGWPDERAKLLDLIGEAIEGGCQPGEVRVVEEA